MTNEDIEKHLPDILGWKPDACCYSGSLFWYAPHTETVIYATPNWEEDNAVPIEYFNGDDYKTFAHVTLPETTLAEQLFLYKGLIELAVKAIDN